VDKHGLDYSRIEHLLTTDGVTCRPERTYSVRGGGCISRHWPHRSHRTEGTLLTAQGRTDFGQFPGRPGHALPNALPGSISPRRERASEKFDRRKRLETIRLVRTDRQLLVTWPTSGIQ